MKIYATSSTVKFSTYTFDGRAIHFEMDDDIKLIEEICNGYDITIKNVHDDRFIAKYGGTESQTAKGQVLFFGQMKSDGKLVWNLISLGKSYLTEFRGSWYTLYAGPQTIYEVY